MSKIANFCRKYHADFSDLIILNDGNQIPVYRMLKSPLVNYNFNELVPRHSNTISNFTALTSKRQLAKF